MNINATLLAQALVFAGLIWVTMEYIWPILLAAMDKREKTIADGLAAAEKGKEFLAEAEKKAEAHIEEARQKASAFIDKAQTRADDIVNKAKQDAKVEMDRIIDSGKIELKREYAKAREELRAEMSGIIITGVEKVLDAELDEIEHERVIKSVIDSIH
ncbi:MAG: F0F1 ATP synthase subunit B [Candidatus Porifericomitaceae bacterium WSBS_2022_MAG_OTU9]